MEDQNWEEFISSQVEEADPVDDQPTEESEGEVESTEETTEHEVEPDSGEETEVEESDNESEDNTDEEEGSEEEQESAPELSDETEIELGEDKQPVTLKELKDGYLRQSDYTKKTQALAEERKQIESLREEVKPVQEWLEWWTGNPYLREQVTNALQEWEQTGVLPLQDVIANAQDGGKYINHLLAENKRLKADLEKTSTEFQSTKAENEFRTLATELKAEYGELVDDDYLTSLRDQSEGLSIDVLKRIADGELAKKQLEQEKQNSKKAVAKAKQKQKSKRLPPQPKPKAQKPGKADPTEIEGDWLDVFKAASN